MEKLSVSQSAVQFGSQLTAAVTLTAKTLMWGKIFEAVVSLELLSDKRVCLLIIFVSSFPFSTCFSPHWLLPLAPPTIMFIHPWELNPVTSSNLINEERAIPPLPASFLSLSPQHTRRIQSQTPKHKAERVCRCLPSYYFPLSPCRNMLSTPF